MASLVPMSELLAAVETDLPEAILGDILSASEEDVTKYLQSGDRPETPVANFKDPCRLTCRLDRRASP